MFAQEILVLSVCRFWAHDTPHGDTDDLANMALKHTLKAEYWGQICFTVMSGQITMQGSNFTLLWKKGQSERHFQVKWNCGVCMWDIFLSLRALVNNSLAIYQLLGANLKLSLIIMLLNRDCCITKLKRLHSINWFICRLADCRWISCC